MSLLFFLRHRINEYQAQEFKDKNDINDKLINNLKMFPCDLYRFYRYIVPIVEEHSASLNKTRYSFL